MTRKKGLKKITWKIMLSNNYYPDSDMDKKKSAEV